MGDRSAIEWTDATWNPTTGCDRVSAGCDNCYALTQAARLQRMGVKGYELDGDPATSGPGFGLAVHPDRLEQPVRWTRPRRIFVNSMSDLFHPDVLSAMHQPVDQSWPVPFLAEVFAVMASTPRHTYQVLTKRPQVMAAVLSEPRFRLDVNARLLARGVSVMRGGFESDWPPNVWLGTSIENDRYAFRARHLRETPAAVRFLSLEPLLGPLPSLDLTGIDWVIVGGESGRNARPMSPEWARDIRDRCADAGVAFFFKQWGTWMPYEEDPQPPFWIGQDGEFVDGHHLPADLSEGKPTHGWWAPVDEAVIYRRTTNVHATRLLDGRVWDDAPAAAAAEKTPVS